MPAPDIPLTESFCADAFHGTSLANAQKIIGGAWKQSIGNQMLGDGVYFFENSSTEAMIWARQNHKPPWAVIKSRVKHGRCLQLIEARHQDLVLRVASQLKQKGVVKVTDALAINALANIAKMDTVRAVRRKRSARPFRTGSPLETGFQMLLCVRTISNILSSEIVVTQT